MIEVFGRMRLFGFKITKFFIVFEKFVKKIKYELRTFFMKRFIIFYVWKTFNVVNIDYSEYLIMINNTSILEILIFKMPKKLKLAVD